MDVAKLKVVELRAELAARGLDQKGNKPVLVARLQSALEAELEDKKSDDDVPLAAKVDDPGEEDSEPAAEETSHSGDHEASQQGNDSIDASFQDESESKEVNEDSVDNMPDESNDESRRENIDDNSVSHEPLDENSASREAVVDEESIDESRDVGEVSTVDETSVQSGYDSEQAGIPQETASEDPDAALGQDSNSQNQDYAKDAADDQREPVYDQNSSSQSKQEPESMDGWQQPDFADTAPDTSFHIDDSNAQDALDAEQRLRASEEAQEAEKPAEEPKPEDKEEMETSDVKDATAEAESAEPPSKVEMDVDVKTETKPKTDENGDVKKEEEEGRRERRRNRWGDAEPASTEAEVSQDGNKSSNSDSFRWKRKRERTSPSVIKPENEPYYDEKEVILSWYDSDLHLIIDKDNFYSATLNNHEGFSYVWAGVRSTYGFEKGKVYYQVKISDELDVSPTLEDEPTPHALRVGWSVIGGLQLGEEPLSYGYGSTGKASANSQFKDYGKPFAKGDVVGCFLDLDANPITIKFSVNGEDQGVAYEIAPEDIKGKPLFPHVLSKNCAFHVNFGEQEPWAAALDEYTFVGRVPIEDRVLGPVKPASRAECEVIMMVGLPAAGKTTWSRKYAAEHTDKAYNILGTNTLLDKMKVMGVARKRNYSGRWETLIAKCTKCLNTLLELAAQRRRNYILDQTNVYPTAQKRKMRGFEGFKRRAVVIMPTDADLKERTAKREAEEGKDVPDLAVLEMKANYGLPDRDFFESVEYVELQEEEAAELIKQYHKEGNDAGFETKREYTRKKPHLEEEEERFTPDRRFGGGFNRGQPDNRGGFRDRNSGGGGRGGGGGGWRDRDNFNRRGDNRDNWGGGGGGRGNWRDRGNTGGGIWNKDGGRGGRGGGRDDRGGDRDKRHSGGNWSNQHQQSGFNNQGGGWGQPGYNNQQWGNWQGYNQNNQWKGYGQQMGQQQGWGGQQGWGNQAQWANWNQQYYNQGWGQQGWGQQQQAGNTTTGTTDPAAVAQQAFNYAQAGAAAQGQAAGQWANYAGYGNTAAQQGAAANTYSGQQQQK